MVILTPATKEEFNQVLSQYHLGKHISHRHMPNALANTVYLVKTTKGVYVLKIFEKTPASDIKGQLRIFLALRGKVPVPRTLKASGKELVTFKGKKVIIQEFVTGMHPKRANQSLARAMGETLARMDIYLQSGPKLSPWKETPFRSPKEMPKVGTLDLKEEYAKISRELKEVKRSRLRTGMIHADFRPDNLLVRKNKLVAILDFDDAHKDYFSYELAVTLVAIFIRSRSTDLAGFKTFMDAYQKIFPLNKDERKAILPFARHRVLGSIRYTLKQIKSHPDIAKSLKHFIMNQIRVYRRLDAASRTLLNEGSR
ncbi:homoserine kinase [Candidatus Woesearchaeota archaeon]|nr:homoserine kinase [Candidatus Woesearchaeota archaeon]